METKRQKFIIYLISAIILFFTLIRMIGIQSINIDVDEALYIYLSSVEARNFLDIVIRLTPDPPLGFYLANIIHKLGYNTFYLMRYFSALSFIFSFVLVALIFKNILSGRHYIVLLLSLSLNPMLLYYSRFAKPYIFEVLLSLSLIYLVKNMLDNYRDYHLLLFGILCSFLFYWSYHSVYFIFASYIGLAYLLYQKNEIKHFLVKILASALVFILFILPWGVTFFHQYMQIKDCWASKITQIFHFSLLGTIQDIFFFIANGNWFYWPKSILIILSVVTIPLTIYSIYLVRKERDTKFAQYISIVAFTPLALALVLSIKEEGFIYYPRMFITSIIPFFLVISLGISSLSTKKVGLVYTILIFSIMMLSSLTIIKKVHPVTPKNISEIIQKIKDKKDDKTAILVHPPILAYLVRAYYNDEFYSICVDVSITQGSTCSSFISFDDRCIKLIKEISSNYQKIILLNNRSISDLMVDPEQNLYKFLSLYYRSQTLYKDSQYELIMYEKYN